MQRRLYRAHHRHTTCRIHSPAPTALMALALLLPLAISSHATTAMMSSRTTTMSRAMSTFPMREEELACSTGRT